MDVSSIKMMGENVSFQKQSNGIIAIYSSLKSTLSV